MCSALLQWLDCCQQARQRESECTGEEGGWEVGEWQWKRREKMREKLGYLCFKEKASWRLFIFHTHKLCGTSCQNNKSSQVKWFYCHSATSCKASLQLHGAHCARRKELLVLLLCPRTQLKADFLNWCLSDDEANDSAMPSRQWEDVSIAVSRTQVISIIHCESHQLSEQLIRVHNSQSQVHIESFLHQVAMFRNLFLLSGENVKPALFSVFMCVNMYSNW